MTTAINFFVGEDLAVLEEHEITQADRLRLAELEPKAVRKDALAWIAAGETADEAIMLAVEKARRVAELAKNPGQRTDRELSDSEWLVAYCSKVRQQLQDPSTFDRGALFYRHTRTNRQVQKLAAEDEIETLLAAGYEPFAALVYRYLFVEHPKDWYICHKCNGRNLDLPECEDCKGCGYKPSFTDRRQK